jgi:hypothetical protein
MSWQRDDKREHIDAALARETVYEGIELWCDTDAWEWGDSMDDCRDDCECGCGDRAANGPFGGSGWAYTPDFVQRAFAVITDVDLLTTCARALAAVDTHDEASWETWHNIVAAATEEQARRNEARVKAKEPRS